MARTRVRWHRVGALVVSVTAAVSLAGGVARAGGSEPGGHYTVRPGDTVWSIARGVAGPRVDLRPVVDRIIAENRLDPGSLQVGERIELPQGL